jgi:xanthine dehydrogenase accessory factor
MSEEIMREIISEIESWKKQGKPVAIATNVRRVGSSLRPLGAKMAMTTTMDIAGSVTGGCIEGVVYEEAQAVIHGGQAKLLHYGVTNADNPWEVGLNCGSSLDVFVESLDSSDWQAVYPTLKDCLEHNRLAVVATVIEGPGLGKKLLLRSDGESVGSLGSEALDPQALHWLHGQLDAQETTWRGFDVAGERVEVFADVLVPPARLVVVGAVHIAIPLVTMARTLGFTTIVIDPRTAFATRERFPAVDELITAWPADALEALHPDEGTYIITLSHDDKLDNPALKVALASPARYVGALGTRRRIGKRMAELRELGATPEQISRLHAPVGMNLGAVLPDEIALSILAEVIAARHGMNNYRPELMPEPAA